MNCNHLRYFLDVVEEGSLTRAARKNHITQPALSTALKKMARELGTDLLVPRGRRLRLTPAGNILYRRGSAWLAQWNNLVNEIRDLGEEPGGEYRLLAGGTAAHYILPELIRRYRVLYPAVRFSLTEGDPGEIAGRLEREQSDLAIVARPFPVGRYPNWQSETFFQDELVLLTPRGYFGSGPSVSVERLRGEKFVEYNLSSAIGALLRAFFERHQVELDPVMELRSIELIKQMVRAETGLAVVSSLAVSPSEKKDLSVYRFREEKLTRDLAMLYRHQYQPRVLTEFMEDLRQFSD